jgi:predicted dehydrogenase
LAGTDPDFAHQNVFDRDRVLAGDRQRVESSHGEEVKVFVKAVKEGLDVASLGAASGEQALMVTQIMDAIYKSSELGKEVTIE